MKTSDLLFSDPDYARLVRAISDYDGPGCPGDGSPEVMRLCALLDARYFGGEDTAFGYAEAEAP